MRKHREPVAVERLREVLDYDPLAGVFTWKQPQAKGGAKIGDRAGGLSNGYIYIGIDGERYPAQRLAWLYVNGEYPARQVQFRNGNKTDFRFENLTLPLVRTDDIDYATKVGRATYARRYSIARPGHAKGQHFKRQYGITRQRFQEMLAAQDGKCAICGNGETRVAKNGATWLSVDHDHTTGAVRALLCRACNLAVGYFREDPKIMRAAADYLERHAALADAT